MNPRTFCGNRGFIRASVTLWNESRSLNQSTPWLGRALQVLLDEKEKEEVGLPAGSVGADPPLESSNAPA